MTSGEHRQYLTKSLIFYFRYQDSLSQAWFANLFIPRWLSVRTNVLCFVLLTSLVLCSFLTSKAPGENQNAAIRKRKTTTSAKYLVLFFQVLIIKSMGKKIIGGRGYLNVWGCYLDPFPQDFPNPFYN